MQRLRHWPDDVRTDVEAGPVSGRAAGTAMRRAAADRDAGADER
ncbi:hypothetical protein [Streptomyces sp. NRRL F-5755]|nr:hypothetical protein [Streptomyces sp. NRRL F-5755]